MAGYIPDRDGLRAYVTDVVDEKQALRFDAVRTPDAVMEFARDMAEYHEDLATQCDGEEEACGPGPWAARSVRERKRAAQFGSVAEQARVALFGSTTRSCATDGHWVVAGHDRCSTCKADMTPLDDYDVENDDV